MLLTCKRFFRLHVNLFDKSLKYMARRWRNRTSHKIVNYPVNGFEAHDVHQKHKPSKSVIIPHRFLFTMVFLAFFSGCGTISNIFNAKSIYDIYGVGVDERSVYHIAKDRYIITQIQSYIAQNFLSKLLKIDVESFYGHVYLIGEYDKKSNINALLHFTKNLENVKHITTYLINSNKRENCHITDDISLIAKVKSALFADDDIWATDIHVHSVNCKVILAGIVKTEVEKLRANAIAKNIEGVKDTVLLIRALN